MLSSILILGFLQGMNLITIFLFISYLLKIPVELRNEIFSGTILIGLCVYLFDFFYICRDFKNIERKYENRTSKSKVFGYVVLAMYIITSVILYQIMHDLPTFHKDGTMLPIQ
jgi:hypothetical protein